MINKKDTGHIEIPLHKISPNLIKYFPGKQNTKINQSSIYNNIDKQKQFLNDSNKFFFLEFSNLYHVNLDLRCKLFNSIKEKRKLKQSIKKTEHQILKKIKNKKTEINKDDSNCDNINIIINNKKEIDIGDGDNNVNNINGGEDTMRSVDVNDNEIVNKKKDDKENNNIFKKIIDNYYISRKRKRRKKTELNNIHICTYPSCEKSYPTKGSLKMHIKLKH